MRRTTPRQPSPGSRKRRGAVAALMSVGLLTLVACGGAGSQAETTESGMTRIVVDYSGTANNAQLALGVERGIFARNGLQVEQNPSSGASANSVALLLNGQIQMAVGEITSVPAAVARGFPVEIVTSLATDYQSPQGDAFSVVVPASSPVRSFADLQGRTVAVNASESIFDLALRQAVRQAGGDPASVNIIAVPFEDQGAALRQGRIDAVSTIEPFAGQLTTDGFRSIGDPNAAALGPRSTAAVMFSSSQFVDENPDVMRRFIQAFSEATQYANDNPEEVRRTIVALTGAPPAAIADLPLPWYVSGVDRRSAGLIAQLMVEQGRLRPPPPALDQFTWTGAPDATDLVNPPRGLQVSG